MIDAIVTTAELLTAWREASRAAELAERLAKSALEAATRADANAVSSAEIAALAQQAADSATRAAAVATQAAEMAAELARTSRDTQVHDAEEASAGALAEEEAKRLYHEAEAEARRLHALDGREP